MDAANLVVLVAGIVNLVIPKGDVGDHQIKGIIGEVYILKALHEDVGSWIEGLGHCTRQLIQLNPHNPRTIDDGIRSQS